MCFCSEGLGYPVWMARVVCVVGFESSEILGEFGTVRVSVLEGVSVSGLVYVLMLVFV